LLAIVIAYQIGHEGVRALEVGILLALSHCISLYVPLPLLGGVVRFFDWIVAAGRTGRYRLG